MTKPFGASCVREVLIRHRPGSDARMGWCDCQLFKRAERLSRAPAQLTPAESVSNDEYFDFCF